jgi:NAD+ synthase (glutamine-hydrolysing)
VTDAASGSTRPLQVMIGQIDLVVGDLAGNEKRIGELIALAEEAGADVLVLPELAITGYPPEDLLAREDFIAAQRAALERLAALTGRCTVLIGYIELTVGRVLYDSSARNLHNSVAVCRGGHILGTQDKRFLPDTGIFDETRWFTPSSSLEPPVVWDIAGHRVGMLICDEMWTEQLAYSFAERDIEVLISVNASPWHGEKETMRHDVAQRAAISAGHVPVVYVNIVGGQDGVVYDGQSFVLSPTGEYLWTADRFHPVVSTVSIAADGSVSGAVDHIGHGRLGPPEEVPEEQLVWEALITGLRDYVDNNAFPYVWLGLSGGIDSAVVATLAADAIGGHRVRGLLMPSSFSSDGSVLDANQLATSLGVTTWKVPIADTYEAVLGELRGADDGGPLGGTGRDVTEENIQARLRGLYLMACANKHGGIVLVTSNKSESAVGYATLGGDMLGGFAPIHDVMKTMVYRLAAWRNQTDAFPGSPIPPNTLVKPPSAELAAEQLDTDHLPPYPLLDAIITRYVHRDLGPIAIFRELTADPETLAALMEEDTSGDPLEVIIERVTALVDANEYKRRLGAPGIKITVKAWGRDRRMPITNRFRGTV